MAKPELVPPHVAVIDDDESLNRALVLHLDERSFRVSAFTSGRDGLAGLAADPPDLVLLDVRLKDLNGIDVLRDIRRAHPETLVVMITAFHETELTVEASRLGAFDYLPKPLDLDKLDSVVDAALARRTEMRRATRPVARGPQPRGPQPHEKLRPQLIGASQAMLEVLKTIGEVAASDVTVLLEGESGTGKELVARSLHAHSQRSGPFLSINCAMLSAELLASELFGHEKGAFTGADRCHKGTFELAQDGTLLLDEVSELDRPIQAKLLRVLQERVFQRLGGSETLSANMRVIAATNRELREMVRAGVFREDLYFRLAVVPIRLPPLRERRDDIQLLVDHILWRKTTGPDGVTLGIAKEALERLVEHDWPGNVRELENVITRAGLRCRGSVILAADVDLPARRPAEVSPAEADLRSLEEVEREHIVAVLNHTEGNKARAVRILGISRPTLDSKLKRYKLKLHRQLDDA